MACSTSQLAIATLLFRDQDSKSSDWPCIAADAVSQLHRARADARRRRAENLEAKRNYRSPHELFNSYGADALRWYFFANQPPWTSIRYSERAIKESIPEFLLRLWHVYSFFVIYATIDGFDPAAELHGDAGELEPPGARARRKFPPIGLRSELDRWILSECIAPRWKSPADGRIRQLHRLPAFDRIRRSLVELVCPPQPRPLLGRRQGFARQARGLLDAVPMPADHVEARRLRSCHFWPRRSGRIWPWRRSAGVWSKAFTSAIFPRATRA